MKTDFDINLDEISDLETKKSLILKQHCFQNLYDKEVIELASLITTQVVGKGDAIVNKGDEVDSVYLIVEGTAEVRNKVFENNTFRWETVATLGPGDAIGLSEAGLFSLSGKRTATVIALSDMTLYRISVPRLHGAMLANAHMNEVMKSFRP